MSFTYFVNELICDFLKIYTGEYISYIQYAYNNK